jgi:hypothetical protein
VKWLWLLLPLAVSAALLYVLSCSHKRKVSRTQLSLATPVMALSGGRTRRAEMADEPSLNDDLTVLVTFSSENDKVTGYRREVLEQAGYPDPYATWLANDLDVDLHRAVDLVTKLGCEPVLAYRILL